MFRFLSKSNNTNRKLSSKSFHPTLYAPSSPHTENETYREKKTGLIEKYNFLLNNLRWILPAEKKALPAENAEEKCNSRGLDLLFIVRQPLGILTAQPRHYWKDTLPGNSQRRRLIINALLPFSPPHTTWPNECKK